MTIRELLRVLELLTFDKRGRLGLGEEITQPRVLTFLPAVDPGTFVWVAHRSNHTIRPNDWRFGSIAFLRLLYIMVNNFLKFYYLFAYFADRRINGRAPESCSTSIAFAKRPNSKTA